MPSENAGIVRVRVSILHGRNLELEDFIAEYQVTDKVTILSDLTKYGIVPFEVRLVRAPPTVENAPEVTNKTKSLLGYTEPTISTMPAFKARFLNISTKAVSGFAYRTSVNGVTRGIAMPRNRQGGMLIAPGESHVLTIGYPVASTTESTGNAPRALSGVKLDILGVMFGDGTYEGEAGEAFRFRGFQIGEKIQLSRIVEVLRSPSANSAEALGAKIDRMSYQISLSEIQTLVDQFPGIDPEIARSAAEASASGIQKDLKKNFGAGAVIDTKVFTDAVKAAIQKCEKWIAILP